MATTERSTGDAANPDRARTVGRWVLAAVLIGAGITHLTTQRVTFRAQVPPWFPGDPDLVVVVSGVVEILLGVGLAIFGRRARWVGVVVAAFFVAIFPGNIAQFVERRDAFGLDSDVARFVRLWFQPVLVVWALWSTGGWSWLRSVVGGSDRRRAPGL